MTNFYPTFSIITRAVDAASSADKVSSYENVTIPEIDLLPMLPAVSRAKHVARVTTGGNEISRSDVWKSEFVEIGPCVTIVRTSVAISPLFFSFQLSPSTVDRKTRYQTKSPQRGCRARLSQTKHEHSWLPLFT